MKTPVFFSRQVSECEHVPASLLESSMETARRTTLPKRLRAKFSEAPFDRLHPHIVWATQQALACPFCYGAKDGKSTEHMAVAIWFLFGAVLSVMGGIGAFSFHLWRHGRMPTEPHQELAEEDLSKYE